MSRAPSVLDYACLLALLPKRTKTANPYSKFHSRFLCVLLCALKSAREIITGFALALVLNPEVFDGETFVIDWCFVTVVTRQSYCHHPLSFHKNKNPTRSQN